LIQAKDVVIRCQLDEKPIDVKMSSDGEAVIVSGIGYIPVSELNGRQPSKVIHVKKAALHVGF
jgi:sulfur transfer protein SufE